MTFIKRRQVFRFTTLIVVLVLGLNEIGKGQQLPGASIALPMGEADIRNGRTAIRHVKLWVSADRVVENGQLVFENGRVVYAGPDAGAPSLTTGTQQLDGTGKILYPAFVELISDLGMPAVVPIPGGIQAPQYGRQQTVGTYWNEHIRSGQAASELVKMDEKGAEGFRKMGFGTVLTHQRDGIARGTAALIALGQRTPSKEMMLVPNAAACYAFQRSAASRQEYPGSLMGAIALLRQTFIEAEAATGTDAARELVALRAQKGLPQLFEAGMRQNILRAAAVGKEAGRNFILRGMGDEYQRLDELKKLNAGLIVPISLPKVPDVTDPLDATLLALPELMHFERAPANAGLVRGAGIEMALTTDQLKDKGAEFWTNLRKCIKAGLSEKEALRALTSTPARMLGQSSLLGTLETGRVASFFITDKSPFLTEAQLMETWVLGERYMQSDAFAPRIAGSYRMRIGADSTYNLLIGESNKTSIYRSAPDTAKKAFTLTRQGPLVTLSGKLSTDTVNTVRLSGWITGANFNTKTGSMAGIAELGNGTRESWSARLIEATPVLADTAKERPYKAVYGAIPYPFQAFGTSALPRQETVLFRNATLWTCEKEGKLEGSDILVQNGKIAAIGKGLPLPAGGVAIDANGMHVTPGVIDEHSHIAIHGGVNECTHSVTAECRVGDVVNPDDPNIYRHLAGGVTAVQQLHGSCNSIGGQASMIKMRWGATAEGMKVAGADGFIKCALGENVKQSNFGDMYRVRYPQTRMGVEQVFRDAFSRAKTYRATLEGYSKLSAAEKKKSVAPARDLQLEALLEILDKKRFITCHSYVASEITMLMRLADSLGFRVNTFTHILEGYKVADQMKAHGAGASTFSDWWYYKMEVKDAIPYNAAILTQVGVVTAINSDDAEMARRLPQEAAKSVRYGGLSEEEALKMVTLNPAILLHLDKQMGSLKVGKDADIVLWNGSPLAPGSRPLRTMVDGISYFETGRDSTLRGEASKERNRLTQLILSEKGKGASTAPFAPTKQPRQWHCEDANGRDESWQ
jgi:imidazolonepropionase-like amidohydrolase